MNVLFTSVGRRYYLLDYFRKNINKKIKIISSNSSNYTSAKNYSDFFYLSPKIQSNLYIKFITSLIKRHKIKLVIPLIDIDAKKLAKNIKAIQKLNAILISPPYKIVDKVTDKYKLYNLLEKNNINCPKSYITKKNFFQDLKLKHIKYPVILKPRNGTSSILTLKANNKKEFNLYYKYLTQKISKSYFDKKSFKQKILIQEYIKGTEFGLDLLNSLERKYFSYLLKQKIEMRNGETDVCKVSNIKISKLCKKISKLVLHNFLIDIDIILKKKKFYIIDINPRIGGGYPFSHSAGFDMMKYLTNQVYLNKKNTNVSSVKKNIYLKDIYISKIN